MRVFERQGYSNYTDICTTTLFGDRDHPIQSAPSTPKLYPEYFPLGLLLASSPFNIPMCQIYPTKLSVQFVCLAASGKQSHSLSQLKIATAQWDHSKSRPLLLVLEKQLDRGIDLSSVVRCGLKRALQSRSSWLVGTIICPKSSDNLCITHLAH